MYRFFCCKYFPNIQFLLSKSNIFLLSGNVLPKKGGHFNAFFLISLKRNLPPPRPLSNKNKQQKQTKPKNPSPRLILTLLHPGQRSIQRPQLQVSPVLLYYVYCLQSRNKNVYLVQHEQIKDFKYNGCSMDETRTYLYSCGVVSLIETKNCLVVEEVISTFQLCWQLYKVLNIASMTNETFDS